MKEYPNTKRHHISGVRDLEPEEFIGAFQTIPADTTHLNLSDNEFRGFDGEDAQSVEDITRAIGSIPASVTHFIFRNAVYAASTDQLVAVFSNLPETVTTLDLANNKFNYQPKFPKRQHYVPLDLPRIFKAIPDTVTTLDLSTSDLFNRSLEATEIDRIVEGLKSLPATITTLILELKYDDFDPAIFERLKGVFEQVDCVKIHQANYADMVEKQVWSKFKAMFTQKTTFMSLDGKTSYDQPVTPSLSSNRNSTFQPEKEPVKGTAPSIPNQL